MLERLFNMNSLFFISGEAGRTNAEKVHPPKVFLPEKTDPDK